jgi:hypothetical protein
MANSHKFPAKWKTSPILSIELVEKAGEVVPIVPISRNATRL